MAAKKKEAIRAFAALDLDTTSLRRVVRLSDRLRMGSGAPSASWTPAAKMHVTLKFMGDLPLDAVVPLGQAIRALAEGLPAPAPCALRLAAFPSTEDARIVVAELEDPGGAMGKLAAKIEKLASKHGVPKDDRAFRPHVTLARLKLAYDARRWLHPGLADGAGACRAQALTLYRSDAGPEGSVYVPLARWEFANAE
jgi:RNA 2',3'-cyclic 3'-phosphodiesterase